MKILLLLDGIRNPVDVVTEKAHDPDAGDVIESLHRLLKRDFPPFLFEFFGDAVRRLDAAGRMTWRWHCSVRSALISLNRACTRSMAAA